MPGPIDDRTHDRLEKEIGEIDWVALTSRSYTPSPPAWEDQILYFLMLDRFSDGKEKAFVENDGGVASGGTTSLFRFPQDAYKADRGAWADAGDEFLGGTLAGLRSKIGYLKRMGITAIWVSPIFKQVVADESYHGYGIMNFLDVDPHFGTRQDLKDLVDEAHANGIYVILDIIFNHAGNVFEYDADRYPTGNGGFDPRWDKESYRVRGYRNAFGDPSLPFGRIDLATHPWAWPNDAVWPAELQEAQTFTRKGRISNWDHDPEFVEGDFVTLRDIDHGSHERDAKKERIVDAFHPSQALMSMCEIFKFWIAFADVDGFRIDTVKHMEIGATRLFASSIQEFAQSVGKENFFLVGEITGGRDRAFRTLELTGLSAALGIDDVQDKLEYLAKGYRNPTDYFGLFRNSTLVQKDSHVWYGEHVVTMIDDHDQVRKGNDKARFCRDGYRHLIPAIALNLTTMGIPCLYYGTEQGFDGAGRSDRFLRECMFGGRFGSLQSVDRHFFDEAHEVYREVAKIAKIRRERIALRRGRQYLREISGEGDPGTFGLPRMIGGVIRSVVPWSRIFNNREILLAINTDADEERSAWVTVDASAHEVNSTMRCLYSTDAAQVGATVRVEARNGRAVFLTIPAAGFAIFE